MATGRPLVVVQNISYLLLNLSRKILTVYEVNKGLFAQLNFDQYLLDIVIQ